MNEKEGKLVARAILDAWKILWNDEKNKLGYDKTIKGKIVAMGINNTYTVQVYNKNYPNIRARDNRTYNINDVVECIVPQNNWVDLRIVGYW